MSAMPVVTEVVSLPMGSVLVRVRTEDGTVRQLVMARSLVGVDNVTFAVQAVTTILEMQRALT